MGNVPSSQRRRQATTVSSQSSQLQSAYSPAPSLPTSAPHPEWSLAQITIHPPDPETIEQQRAQEEITVPLTELSVEDRSSEATQSPPLQMTQKGPSITAPAVNTTGLPDQLKAGIEHISGLSLDDVHVHYNSAQPAQAGALAYAQGTDIHVGPGQERHLPHEAWHVVQQKQGRVRPTFQTKGMAINDDQVLENEASVMGAKAITSGPLQEIPGQHVMAEHEMELQGNSGSQNTKQQDTSFPNATQKTSASLTESPVIQRAVIFYWHPEIKRWHAYEDNEEPIGYPLYNGQQYEYEFDWDRWRNDPTYNDWWQEQLGPTSTLTEPEPASKTEETQSTQPSHLTNHPTVTTAPTLQFSAPTTIEGGYKQVTCSLNNQVIGRAKYSATKQNIPGDQKHRRGIELSEVFVESDQRNKGYSTKILDYALQLIGLNETVWLDAQAQSKSGLGQAELINWYGRHGFEAIGSGNIMVTIDMGL